MCVPTRNVSSGTRKNRKRCPYNVGQYRKFMARPADISIYFVAITETWERLQPQAIWSPSQLTQGFSPHYQD